MDIFNLVSHTWIMSMSINVPSQECQKEVINYFKVCEVKWLPCRLLQHVMLLCFPAYWWLFICHRSLSLTIVFPFFANYNDTLHCMPCWKINKPKGTTESWPCSCSRIIANRLLWLLKETCQYVTVCVPASTIKTVVLMRKRGGITHVSWANFYCWVKWQACFLYINNNYMKEHTIYGYLTWKQCLWTQCTWAQDVDNDNHVFSFLKKGMS